MSLTYHSHHEHEDGNGATDLQGVRIDTWQRCPAHLSPVLKQVDRDQCPFTQSHLPEPENLSLSQRSIKAFWGAD
jgi:hypothetical protein